ncbi:MAG: tRNA (adenosine(37)-N6)-dimethylallyltransferase MiaA [Candidatus Omnitrophica bacterium]|nr:tRNA (adenosine(37)-N6)-dimethylallyltransferase MiaA [Candidatus Omnitrophota bacterium]
MRVTKDKIIFIVGPTATGKTRLGIRLARRLHSEIISADSMQIYKGMSIISQAPTKLERRLVRHHMVGFVDPIGEFSVAHFCKKAVRIIKSALRNRDSAVVVGGSGLYIKALIDGIFPSPEADLAYRDRLYKYAIRNGSPKLHEKLETIDPESAGKIHPNDTRRIVRALEIYHSTGKTKTELVAETKGLKDEYDVFVFGLNKPRENLYSDIEDRVDKIFSEGAVSEVKRLLKKDLSRTASAILGFKEISGHLNGDYGLDEAKELLAKNTRNFAKRQLTWFRADKRIKWFDVSRLSDAEIIKKILKEAGINKDKR